MPGETGEVSSIGVKLTLDAGEFMGGMKAAQGSLNTFQQQAAKAGSGASQLKAGGGKQTASGPSSAQNLAGVNVSLALSDSQLAQLRRRIQGALQNIPITVTTAGSKSARAEAQSVVAAVSTPAIGTRTGAAHAVDRAVRQNLPQKAHGGPVQAGRAVIVGEHRPEVFIPRSHGHIEPDAERFYRAQEQFRRREAELASLNYQQQRRHEREMGRFAGGPVEGPLARRLREGPASPRWKVPEHLQDREGQYDPTIEHDPEYMPPRPLPEWMRRAREQRLPPKVYRMAGGPVENVSVAALRKMLYEDRENFPRPGQGATDLAELTRDIARNGVREPIALRYDPTHHAAMVGDGNTRVAAAIRLGLKSVPAYAQSIGPQAKRHHKLVGLSGDPVNAARGEMLAPSLLGIRRHGGPAHAGAGAIALRATLANEGGTFPLYGGPQPPKGYAVGIETGTSQLADPNDPRDFFRKYSAQRKAQMAAGDFPPFVGTWLHKGQIHIDPAAVLGRRREADLVARAKSQLAFFDLKRFDEIPTSTHKLRATAERINQLIMSGRKRQEGGPASAFRSSGKPSELMHRFGLGLGSQGLGPFEPGPGVSHDIDRIRGMTREHWLGIDELVEGRPFVIGQAIGDTGSVRPGDTKMRPGLPGESQRRWRDLGYGRRTLRDTSGLVGIHNHPLYKGSTDIWRPSLPDIRTMFQGEERESWVVTPHSTQIMRPRGHSIHRDPGQIPLARSMAEELAQAMGVREEEFIKGTHIPRGYGASGADYFTPAFIKAFSSKEVLQSFDLQRRMLDRVGGEYGFDWELWKHPPGPYTKTDPAAIPRPSRSRRPSAGQLTFGMMAGGYVKEARRARAYGITHAHGNIKGWENAQWRHQEMLEIEDRIRAARKEAESRRIPGFATSAWETFPLPAEPLVPLTGETGKLWGDEKRAGGPVHAKQGAVVGRMTQEELDFAGNLRAAAARISPDQMKFGKAWYADAQNWINEQSVRYGIDPTTVRGVTAALSAGTSWQANKTKAHRVLQTHRMGLFGESFPYSMKLDAHGKARAILEGADPERILGHTPKVGSFYRNLGGDLDAVTLDRWAFRTATRGHLSAYGEGPVRNDIDAAYRQVAAELGLHPSELQAASWLYEKETNPLPNRKGKPQSLGQLEDMFSPMRRRAAGGIAVAGQPHGLVHPGGGFVSQIFQTAADWANDPFMAIMSYQSMQAQHRQAGGPVRKLFTVADELGLHMRPSAHLARMAADYDAVITIQNMTRGMPREGTANAQYMWHWLALAAKQGNQLQVSATGTDAEVALRALGALIESPGLTRIASANRSLEKVDPARLRAAEIFGKFSGRAGGGKAGGGLYIVGEIGPELFVPNRLAGRIPKKVMDQIPRAANGGIVEIGRKRNELFAPPEDGIIIPNRLIDQIPHAERGTGTGDFDFMGARIPGNRLQGMERFDTQAQVDATMAKFSAERGRAFAPPPAYGVSADYQPTQVAAQTQAMEAETVNVTASGATTVNTQNATAAGAAGAAAAVGGRRLSPGLQNIGGVAVPPNTSAEDLRSLRTRLENMSPADAAQLSGMQTAEEAGATYEEHLRKTVATGGAQGSRERRYRGVNMAEELAQGRAGVGKEMPSRTPQGAVASVASFLFGGVQQMTQAQVARAQAEQKYHNAQRHTEAVVNKAAGSVKKLREEVAAGTVTNVDAADIVKNKLAPAVREARSAEKMRYEDLERTTKKAMPTTGGVLRNLGVIIGATTLYGAAMQAASMVIEQAVIPAAGKWVDEMTGWTPTFTRVSTAMADNTRQQGGNYKAAVAAASATAGLSLETETWVETSLKASTTAKAGAKAMTEARDLMAAALGSENKPNTGIPIDAAEATVKMMTMGVTDLGFLLDRFRSGPAGSPQGLYGGYGGVGGTALFAEQLGGGAGFQQQITDFMRVNTKPTPTSGLAGTAQTVLTGAATLATGPIGGLIASQVTGAILGPLGGTKPGPGTKHMVANMQSAMGRAAGQEGVLPYGIRETKGDEVAKLEKMGADQTVIDMAKLGYVYTDSVGNLVANLDELDRAVGQVAKGMTIPEMGTWFKTITRQMGGQFQMAQQTQARAIETEIPIETWKSLVQQPLLGAGAGVVGAGGVSAAGFSGQTATWAKGLISDIKTSNQALTDMGKAGFEAARVDVQTNNPLALPQFDALAAEANTASAKIQGLNSEIAKLSQEAAQANWANQIRIARRSLGDALGMLGRIGGTRLGQLQREQWLNSRASQQLGLQLQQRQITTQLALAQFQAPGETGEERYFRQKQTVAEAGVAQTQLGFSFKEFTISGQLWKITAERAATDATKAIEVMTVAQNAQLGAALAAQAISNEQRKLGVTMGKIDAILSTAKTNWGTVMQAAGQYVTQFGGSVKDAMKEVWKALGYTVKEDKYGKVSISGTSNAGQMGGPGYSAQPTSPRPAGENWTWNGYGWVKGNAKGYLGNFARGAMMTVGEAGPETVAILRNPRAATMGGGGGPSNVTVNINGPVVRGDADISSLARQVAAEVERTLSRKGQMFGLRGPAV